ncbi:MAG: amphi-Trp domain-containing protein [Desulfovibrionaceae bacterium]
MSKKTVLFESEETQLSFDAATLLRKLGDDMARGAVELPGQAGAVRMEIPREVTVEIEAKEKAKSKGTKHSLDISLEWYDAAEDAGEEE